jgi:hypothetical protein
LPKASCRSPRFPRREAILISDFQKSGWTGAEDIRFGDNITLTPVSVAEGETNNISIPSVTFSRAEFSGQERITVSAGIMNRNAAAAPTVPVSLEIEGRTLETIDASIGANASASVSFAPFTLAEPTVRGTVKAGSDPLVADNAFNFVLSPSKADLGADRRQPRLCRFELLPVARARDWQGASLQR